MQIDWDFPNDGPITTTPFDKRIELHDGRTLRLSRSSSGSHFFSYSDYGLPDGEVFVYFAGTPGCRIYPWGGSPLLR
jgi:hypothetical protein